MTGWLIPLAVGAATGVRSGFGVGGGTLLLVYLTAVAGVDQHLAQGINLLYFLPAGQKALLPCITAGLVCAALCAWAATGLEADLLRKLFGGFLVLIGLRELLGRGQRKEEGKPGA